MTDLYAHHFARFIPSGLRAVGQWLLGRPAAAAGLIAVGLALEIAGGPLRARVAARLHGRRARLVRVDGARPGRDWSSSRFAASLLVPYPQLPLEPSHPMTAAERVVAVVRDHGDDVPPREPELPSLVHASGWASAGSTPCRGRPSRRSWCCSSACALCALLLRIARRGEGRRLLWLSALGAGSLASLVLYTLSTQGVPMALQGRYLIGWYLTFLAVVGTALALDHRSPSRGRHGRSPSGGGRAVLLLAVAGSIHVYCLSFMLRRYF